jgi:hypothetical protein
MNIIALNTVVAASMVMLIKTFVVSKVRTGSAFQKSSN